jgi:hypothetical protein
MYLYDRLNRRHKERETICKKIKIINIRAKILKNNIEDRKVLKIINSRWRKIRRNTENFILFLWRCGPTQDVASSLTSFLYPTQRRTKGGRTLLVEWSVRCRDVYLTTHNSHNRQTSMSPVGFEPTIPAGERPQTYALDTRGHWDRLRTSSARQIV